MVAATKQRKKDRQRQTQGMLAFAEKNANDIFSKLVSNTNSITQEIFDNAWGEVDTLIERKSKGSISLYENGFNKALSTAISFIDTYQWQVNACYHFVRIPREKSLRDESWIKHAFIIYEVYEQWEKDLQTNGFADNVDDAFADFLLSAIFHSGVCDPQRLLGVVDTLQMTPRLSTFNSAPYLLYTVPDNRAKHTNQSDETGRKCHRGLCFLAPPTLALFNHFLKHRKKNWACENTLKSLFDLLERRCGFNFFRGKLKSAIFVTENITALNQPEVNFLIGHLPSFSLPEGQFVSLKFKPPISQPFSVRRNSVHSNQSEVSEQYFAGDFYVEITRILAAASKQLSANSRKNRETVINSFENIIDKAVNKNELVLIQWFLHLFNQKKKISTLRRYHTGISRMWLANTEGQLLSSYSMLDFESLYANVLEDIPNVDERGYAAGRLKSMHEFCVGKYHFPKLSTDFFSQITQQGRPHVRAGVVSEVLYQQLLLAIANSQNTNQDTIDTITAIVIVAFRCGLRLGEIIKLQTKDVLTDLRTTRLYIAPNKYGTNKTESGNRMVPLSIMLLPAEKQLLDKHINKRRQGRAELLFSMPDNPMQPIMGQQISNMVIYYLRQISGDDSYVFHHLRHSCMSRLQLILHGETIETLPLFVPYDKEQTAAIQNDIYGKHDKVEYALAKFAGHSSPATTYESYFHFTEYTVGKKLSMLKLNTQGKLTNKSKSLEKLIAQCQKSQYLDAPQVEFLPSPSDPAANGEGEVLKKTKTSLPLITTHDLLKKHHAGEAIDVVLMLYDVEKDKFEHWYENALRLRAETLTWYGNSKLFTTERMDEIVPTLPKTAAERNYIEKLIPLFREKYRNHKNDFVFAINHTLANSSATNSGVMFYDAEAFTRYVNTLVLLRVKSHLHVITHRADSKAWKKALKGIRQQSKTDEAIDYQKQRRGSVRLLLIHPDEKNILANQNGSERKMKKRERYSSNLLVYLFHMMAIMLGGYGEK